MLVMADLNWIQLCDVNLLSCAGSLAQCVLDLNGLLAWSGFNSAGVPNN